MVASAQSGCTYCGHHMVLVLRGCLSIEISLGNLANPGARDMVRLCCGSSPRWMAFHRHGHPARPALVLSASSKTFCGCLGVCSRPAGLSDLFSRRPPGAD